MTAKELREMDDDPKAIRAWASRELRATRHTIRVVRRIKRKARQAQMKGKHSIWVPARKLSDGAARTQLKNELFKLDYYCPMHWSQIESGETAGYTISW